MIEVNAYIKSTSSKPDYTGKQSYHTIELNILQDNDKFKYDVAKGTLVLYDLKEMELDFKKKYKITIEEIKE